MKRECDVPRVRGNWWHNENRIGVGLGIDVDVFSGLSLELEGRLLGYGFMLRVRVFYSAGMELRSLDRFNAEMLAGEYPGVTLTTSEVS